MNQIPPYSLWVGNAHDCRNPVLVSESELRYVVQLSIEEPIPELPREIHFFRIPLHDGNDNSIDSLQLAISTISDLLQSEHRTLVCCSAGLSRSPAIAACAIAFAEEKHPDECLNEVSNVIRTDVSPGFWQDLLNAHSSLIRK